MIMKPYRGRHKDRASRYEVVIDSLISATVIEKKSGKKEFRVKDVDTYELKIKEQ